MSVTNVTLFLPRLILTNLGSELPDEIDLMSNFNMNHFGKIINCETPKKEKPSSNKYFCLIKPYKVTTDVTAYRYQRFGPKTEDLSKPPFFCENVDIDLRCRSLCSTGRHLGLLMRAELAACRTQSSTSTISRKSTGL